MIVAFRRQMLLPPDDCLHARQPSLPHLTRPAPHRCLRRYGLSRLPDSHDQRRDHLVGVLTAWKFPRKLGILGSPTPCRYICKARPPEPDIYGPSFTEGSEAAPAGIPCGIPGDGRLCGPGAQRPALASSRLAKPRPTSTLLWKPHPWPRNQRQSAYGKPGAVQGARGSKCDIRGLPVDFRFATRAKGSQPFCRGHRSYARLSSVEPDDIAHLRPGVS